MRLREWLRSRSRERELSRLRAAPPWPWPSMMTKYELEMWSFGWRVRQGWFCLACGEKLPTPLCLPAGWSAPLWSDHPCGAPKGWPYHR